VRSGLLTVVGLPVPLIARSGQSCLIAPQGINNPSTRFSAAERDRRESHGIYTGHAVTSD
jgi:hypothetical protein